MNLNKEFFFPTITYFADLEDAAALNQYLKTRIYAWRDLDQDGITRSNTKRAGAWHSHTTMNVLPEYKLFVDQVNAVMAKVFEDQLYSDQYFASCHNMWANVSPKGGYNRSHVHPGSLWSGVYYVQTPEHSGRIIFQDPRPQVSMVSAVYQDKTKAGPQQWQEINYEPIAGRMILFPSWLRHEVESNLNELGGDDADRISISFNYGQAPIQKA